MLSFKNGVFTLPSTHSASYAIQTALDCACWLLAIAPVPQLINLRAHWGSQKGTSAEGPSDCQVPIVHRVVSGRLKIGGCMKLMIDG